jgi:hypothetical protein
VNTQAPDQSGFRMVYSRLKPESENRTADHLKTGPGHDLKNWLNCPIMVKRKDDCQNGMNTGQKIVLEFKCFQYSGVRIADVYCNLLDWYLKGLKRLESHM